MYINEFVNNKLHYRLHLPTYRRLRQHVSAITYNHFQGLLLNKGYIELYRPVWGVKI